MKLQSVYKMVIIGFIYTIIILLGACLGGCTTTKTVYVPTPYPKVTIPPEPRYPLQDVKPGEPADKAHKAAWATIVMQHDYIHGQLLPRLAIYAGKN